MSLTCTPVTIFNNMKTLNLNLTFAAYEVTGTPEKMEEYRVPSKWIRSRLFNKDGTVKHYDTVTLIKGYTHEFKEYRFGGFSVNEHQFDKIFSNGLCVRICEGHFIISLGELVRSSTTAPNPETSVATEDAILESQQNSIHN